MNQAEIMTLLSNKVKAPTISTAIMAGKISGILNTARRQVDKATNFKAGANWTEILRLLEGEMDSEIDHRADELETSTKKRRDFT